MVPPSRTRTLCWVGLAIVLSWNPVAPGWFVGAGAAQDWESKPAAPGPARATIRGVLHSAPRDGQGRYFLTTDQGELFELEMAKKLIEAAGGASALDGQRVQIRGERLTSPSNGVRVQIIEFE